MSALPSTSFTVPRWGDQAFSLRPIAAFLDPFDALAAQCQRMAPQQAPAGMPSGWGLFYQTREATRPPGTHSRGSQATSSNPRSSRWRTAASIGAAGILVMTSGLLASYYALNRYFVKPLLEGPSNQVRSLVWPIQLAEALYKRYVDPYVEVTGLEGAGGIFVLNHPYRSALDGFIFSHMLLTRTGRVPKVLITGEHRNALVRLQRWLLQRSGVAVIVPPDSARLPRPAGDRPRLTDLMTQLLKNGDDIVLFPAGQAVADSLQQLNGWSTSAVFAARNSGRTIVPVAVGGMPFDWTPEEAVLAGWDAERRTGQRHPYRFTIRIGAPFHPGAQDEPDVVRNQLVESVQALMKEIPGLLPPEVTLPYEGAMTLADGRTLAYLDRGPKGPEVTTLLYFHGLQGSRLEASVGLDALLERLRIRLVAIDRPGIGRSSPRHQRTLSDWKIDVQALTQALIPGQPFSILGFSAGTAYALACHALPGLRAIGLISPMRLPSFLTSWASYRWKDQKLLLAARLIPGRFMRVAGIRRDQVLNNWPAHSAETLASLSLDDSTLLARPELNQPWRINRQEGYRQGRRSILQDVRALLSPLKIRPKDFRDIPVLIVHGAKDLAVPPGVARWLHRWLPWNRAYILGGRGHYFIYDESVMEMILLKLKQADQAASADPAVLKRAA